MDGCLEQTKVQHMQEYIDQLKKENRYLKGLLDRAGISYNQTLSANQPPGEQAQKEAFASNQGAGIQPVEISAEDFVKDPYVLDFLDLKDYPALRESDLGQALIDKLQEFLLELGRGFCFVARQKLM